MFSEALYTVSPNMLPIKYEYWRPFDSIRVFVKSGKVAVFVILVFIIMD